MRIAVLGDGGWGTAIALLLRGNGHDVTLWGPFPEYLEELRQRRENVRFLPGVPMAPDLALAADMGGVLAGAGLVVLATPAQYMRGVLERVRQAGAPAGALFLNVAKGIEVGTLERMSEMVAEVLGPVRYAVLSGPSHAEEVARGVPTAVVAAAAAADDALAVQRLFSMSTFRVYTSADVTGLELGGSLKNVLALAAGMCDGMGLGDNSKAALMTRGIVEMARLGKALGGRPETFSGLSGIGDLIVTCISRHSRNRHVGEELGRGRTLTDVRAAMGLSVAEGVETSRSAYALARRAGVSTPIVDEVYASLHQGKDPRRALRDLMSREPKPERAGDEYYW